MFCPYLYSIVPVQESQICMCEFYNKDSDANVWTQLTTITSASIFKALTGLNLYMFLIANFVFLLGLMLMGFRIKFIKDNLSLNTELMTVVIVWTSCSTL